jgi:C-terminal processing protease CtpA/Prc
LIQPDQRTVSLYPIRFYQFADGLFVRGTAPEQTQLLGAKILKIGPLDVDAALDAARPYCHVDNAMGYLANASRLLSIPSIIEAIGGASDPSGVDLTIQRRDGTTATVRLAPIEIELRSDGEEDFSSWKVPYDTSADAKPLYLKNLSEPLWRQHLPDERLVYVAFQAVRNPKGSTIREFASQLFDFIDRNDVEYLVIDMRRNTGGNTDLVMPLIHGLIKCDKVNRPGHLFVIIGRRTFSAAMNTTSMIEIHTNATVVGEPTGSSPNFVGESTWFVLPYHRNRVYCSSRYWQFANSVDQRTWIEPQIPAAMTFDDYANNRDPAMAAILAAIAPR